MSDPTDPSHLADRPPGYDEEDPYEDVDVDLFPAWWRENIEEFQHHDLRPYRPPRFDDGELVPPVVVDLEAELDVRIRLQVLDPQDDNDWEVVVDGRVVASVDRDRHVDGYSVYHLTAEEFERIVRGEG